MRRRDFLQRSVTIGGAAISWMILPPMTARAAERDLIEVTLEARPYRYPRLAGTVFSGLAYNGSVPGPLLRVRHGQTFRARFRNDTGGPSAIHWHGMILPNDMDGVPGITQPAVANGGEFVYTFKPGPPGLRWYHSHVEPQSALGLFGAFIVEEPHEPRADVEAVLVLHDVPDMHSFWAAVAGQSTATMAQPPGLVRQSAMQGMSGMSGMSAMSSDRKRMPMRDEVAYRSHCIDGAAYPHTRPLIVKVGQSVRLRIVNASPTLTHYLRLAGHRLRVTHSDGNPLKRSVTVDALRIGVAERYDAWFEVTRPGAWLLHSLTSQAHDRRQSVLIRTGDAAHRAPQLPPPSLADAVVFNYRLAGEAEPIVRPSTDPFGPADVHARLALGGGRQGDPRWTIDGRVWPQTPKVRVRRGDRVLIHFTNPTAMDHPMHLHGHVFDLIGVSGTRLALPLPKDTALVPAGGSATWQFAADAFPGRWLLHCHNAVHMIDGMMTEVDYVDA